jgi:hypothetical protein
MVIPTSNLVRQLPRWGMSALRAMGRAFWDWYRKLSLVPMFIVTCVVGAAAFVAAGRLPLPGSELAQLRHGIEGLLVVAVLLVILVGLFRGGRSG